VAADPRAADPIHEALAELGGRGGIVHLPPGEFGVANTVALPDDTSLVGAGPGRTTITLAPGASCHVFTNADHLRGNRNIELRGFRLEGNIRSQHRPSDLKGITFACGGYFKRVEHLRVSEVAAHGIRQTAFHFNHCAHVDLEDVTADELGWSGVSTSGTDDIVLRRVVVTRSGLDVRHSGIHLDGGRGAYVEATVDGSTGNGIMLDSKFAPLSDVVVMGSASRSMRGLSLSGDHDNGLRNVSASGDFSDNRECGLLVSNASNVFVLDATLSGNGTAGIVIQGKAGSGHCVVARTRITGSPQPVVERDGNRLAYITSTTQIPTLDAVEPLYTDASAGPRPTPPSSRLRTRVSQRRARARSVVASLATSTEPAPAAPRPSAASTGNLDDDHFDGVCNVCGAAQTFARRNASLREGYRCARCKASLRYRGQADAILRTYARHGSGTIADLVAEPEFARLTIWEPGVLGPLRAHFAKLPGYVMSDYWPDVPTGDERDGVRCEDLMALTFEPGSFDLVVTSDIFEHVRKPEKGFAEVHRVLRSGGRHVFSIPIQEPWRAHTVERVDTSGQDDVHLLEPRYHLGPGNSQHLVYNDFGRDLVDRLRLLGFETEVIRFAAPSAEASRLLTLCSTKR